MDSLLRMRAPDGLLGFLAARFLFKGYQVSEWGGARRGAGRPKGGTSQKTREIAMRAAAEGITPLEVMVQTMREFWEAGDKSAAAAIAKDAAPYMHPRLQSTEAKVTSDVTINDSADRPPRETRDEWMARRRRELAGQLQAMPVAGNAD